MELPDPIEVICSPFTVLPSGMINSQELAHVAVFLFDLSTIVKPCRQFAVLADEPDNRILECAVTGGADAIVAGDKALLQLKIFRKVKLLSPGIAWLLIQRGNNPAVCFYAEEDYRLYPHHLQELSLRLGCAVHAYVLMTATSK
jgi:hypothetical protein